MSKEVLSNNTGQTVYDRVVWGTVPQHPKKPTPNEFMISVSKVKAQNS